MPKPITKAEFEELAAANFIEEERDTEYSYESVIDQNGKELGFATYRTGQEPTYTLLP